ncbi:hypothetical protein MPL1_04502 [Methylophaga lonarensis MPL]|uniref:Uncharacterized protein n=1 Tax=Methylophaga lonarensis MPL TaxID=1286106 RepID=M7PI26_9GAMM|nr:hypothetical protein MPL1_04502 [Methylophaga lonarensis MPL]
MGLDAVVIGSIVGVLITILVFGYIAYEVVKKMDETQSDD